MSENSKFDKKVCSYEEFIEESIIKIEKSKEIKEPCFVLRPPLFRGQSNSDWSLSTTLERKILREIRLSKYYSLIYSIVNKVNMLSNYKRKWDLPHPSIKDKEILVNKEVFEYMVYLRHHGFLSPLLDWTMSPYIASYFAFKEDVPCDNVAIFMYNESVEVADIKDTEIISPGDNIETHERHFFQQTNFTYCKEEIKDELFFRSHEKVCATEEEGNKDVLVKYIIPKSERIKVLQKLKLMNITEYTLFHTEDAFIKTLAFDSFDLK